MNPTYKFTLSINGNVRDAFPVYNNSMSKDFDLEQGQRFFRAKLSGRLIFSGDDYSAIVSAAFDAEFGVVIFISYDGGQSWSPYWEGSFWKTDCEFDEDSRSVSVTPSVKDRYTGVLAGLEKEYNLIDLLPEIVSLKADKRPMIQVYVPGQTVIACFLSGMWWEQECEAVSNVATLTEVGNGKLNFALNSSRKVVEISGGTDLPDVMIGETFSERQAGAHAITGGGYRLEYFYTVSAGGSTARWSIVRESDDVTLWQYTLTNSVPSATPYTVTLTPVSGTGATGDVYLYVHDISVYSRYVSDVDNILGVNTYTISETDDIVPNNRNYRRVVGYNFPNTILYSTRLSENPTQYGIYQPGQYYDVPPGSWYLGDVFPIARSAWGRVSLWFTFSAFDWMVEEAARAPFELKDAYPLASVISVLLGKIAPGITHEQSVDYSQFLYGSNPITGIQTTPVITPKSNVIYAGYDQPAQKAPITLKQVLDMLRDCFRCYWYIDSANRFRIEHIRYFMNGGSYNGTPAIGIDLTTQKVSRSGMPWAYGMDKYTFDKPEMAERYQFGWMDDVTELFEGEPIDMVSKYVEPGRIEQINIQKFTSDIDYILLNPESISKDGFVLMLSAPVSWVETLSQTRTFSWNGGGIQTDISLTAYRGKMMRITVNTSSNYLSVLQSGTDFSSEIGAVTNQPSTDKTFEFMVNENADHIALYIPSPGAVAISSLKYRQGEYQLPYYQTGDSNLQNGYAAFVYLQQYYFHDMPARLFQIGGVQYTALGMKKLKTQTTKFPVFADPDLLQLIKTNLGNGMIEKLSVNLSSREANATLRYDTE